MNKHLTIRFHVRIPSDLDAWLTAKAAANHRSKNGEIINLIEKYKKQDEQLQQQELAGQQA